ncbi:MAG: hypothetical protein P8181_11155 [bacterium]
MDKNTDRLRQLMIPNLKSKNIYLKTLVFVAIMMLLFLDQTVTERAAPDHDGIDRAAAMVSSRILLTRQKARASNTRYRIHCDYRSGVCRIYREAGRGRWAPDLPDDTCLFPEGVSLSPSSRPADGFIEIDETGAILNQGDPVVLKLTDQDGTLRSIRISSSGTVQECSSW